MVRTTLPSSVASLTGRRVALQWGHISGVEKTSPRTEMPTCIDSPVSDGSSALIVGDYKLLLGPQILACKCKDVLSLASDFQLLSAVLVHRLARPGIPQRD